MRRFWGGAEKILTEHKPKLAIVVGFDEEMVLKVPQIIHSINPAYKFWLRFNRGMIATLTLYGMAD